MKTISTSLLFFAMLLTTNSNAQSSSNFDWLQGFYNLNPNYDSIVSKADEFFEDTSYHHGEYGYKDYLRWKAFWSSRIGVTDEEISAGDPQKNFDSYAKSMSNLLNGGLSCGSNESEWEFLGPKSLPQASGRSPNGMGFIQTIEIDTTDHTGKTFYVGGASGGVWKTTNGGTSWTCITESSNIPVLGIGDIAIDPNDNQTIYIATETNRFRRSYGVGVLKTTNGGNSWQLTGLNFTIDQGEFTRNIKTHPSNSNKLIATVRDKIYRSTDAGTNWTLVNTIPKNYFDPTDPTKYRIRNWRDILYHPSDTNIVYASSDDFGQNDGGAVIHKSTDGGINWIDITSNINTVQYARIDLSVTPQKPNSVYIAASRNGISYIKKSLDKGVNWQDLGDTRANRGGTSMQDFEISPADTTVMYIGGIDIAKSTNEGSSFSKIESDIVGHGNWVHDDTRDIAIVSATVGGGSDTVLSGNDGGISITYNGGSTWIQSSNNMSLTDFWSLDVAEDNTFLVGGMQDQGFLHVDLVNDVWKNANYYADGGDVEILDSNSNYVIGIRFPGTQVVRSTNSGESYSHLNYANVFDFFHPYTIGLKFASNSKLYASPSTVYKYNGGSSWSKLDTFPISGNEMKALAISESHPNVMYASRTGPIWSSQACSTITGRIFRTNDGGQTWTDISSGLCGLGWAGISDIAINPNDTDEVWVTHENTWLAHRVSYTNDGGQTWSDYSTGLTEYPVTTIKYVKNSNDALFIGTDVGVYYRNNTMSSWECFNNNMPVCLISDLNVNECGGILYAATHGRALWKSSLPSYTINGNETWSQRKQIGSDLIIEGNLTIKDTVEMAEGTKITVKPGSKLLLDGGVIKASDCANGLWGGIELQGQSNSTQDYQNIGAISMINGAVISGAKVGIRNGITDENGFVNGTSGGFFYGNNATFLNNLTDIKMHPYENINPLDSSIRSDRSICNNCSFISDQNLPNGQVTKVHVDIEGVVGVELNGAFFDNQLQQSTLTDRGKAIKAINSSFYVIPFSGNRAQFNNFYLAVDCYTQNLSYIPVIDQADFIDNVQGARIAGNDYAEITRNTFEILDESGHDCYGLYLDYCNAYTIEENEFSYTGTGTANGAVGILVNNSKDDANDLYKNTFDDLQVGTLVHGDNSESGTERGLVLKCNEYNNNGYHIALNQVSSIFATIDPKIAENQEFTPGSGDAVGNTFGPVCSGGTEEDLFVDNGGNAIDYYHFTDNITIPECRTLSKVTNINAQTNFDPSSDCPSNFGGGGGGPWGPPGGGFGLVRNNTDQLAKMLKTSAKNKSGSDGNYKFLNYYVRTLLKKDTIPVDSIVWALDQYGDEMDEVRKVAILSRLGINSFKANLPQMNLGKKAEQYADFIQEVDKGGGSLFAQAKQDATHPYFMYVRAKLAQEKGAAIPAPVNLPAKRIIISDNRDEESVLNIYPNPADNQLILDYEGEGRIEVRIYDMKGSEVKSLILKEKQVRKELTVRELNNGIYVLKVLSKGKELGAEKISIQH